MVEKSHKERHRVDMSRIRSKNTIPEMVMRNFLHKKGLRFQLHDIRLPGKPDLVFPKYKTVVFVHGCFWHHHECCKLGKIPKKNQNYWIPTLTRNVNRDLANLEKLTSLGWNIIVVWECELYSTILYDRLNDIHDKIISHH